jgi:tetratricopeptide (TPR) repeat protein
VSAVLRLIYIEIQYWLVGLTPETYYWAKARAWEDFGDFRRATNSLSAYLKNSDDPQVRALLAYCYARRGDWARTADEYTRVLRKWNHPSIRLGLAEAERALGETEKARELIAELEKEQTPLAPQLEQALAILKGQLAAPKK